RKSLKTRSPPVLDSCDAIDFEATGPGRHIDEDPCRRIFRKLTRIDRVDRGELLDRSAINIALQNLVQGRASRLQTKLHLFNDDLGLPLDRRVDDLAGRWIERRKSGDVDRVSVARNRRCRSLPALQI